MIHKIRLPLAVCRDGALAVASFTVSPEGKIYTDPTMALECVSEDSYNSGYRIIMIEAEIDVDDVFAGFNIKGKVIKDDINTKENEEKETQKEETENATQT